MEKAIEEALNSFGLKDKEKKVYLTMLELGDSPASKITQQTGLNRVTVYPVLKSLIEKGFASEFEMHNKTHFRATPPEEMLDRMQHHQKKIEDALPLFNDLMSSRGEETSVKVMKGGRVVPAFFDRLYNGDEKELWMYGNSDTINKILAHESNHAKRNRIDRGIKLNILTNGFQEEHLTDTEHKRITDIRLSQKLRDMDICVIFGKRRSGILDLSKEVDLILIENKEIASYHKLVYDTLSQHKGA